MPFTCYILIFGFLLSFALFSYCINLTRNFNVNCHDFQFILSPGDIDIYLCNPKMK